MARLPRRCTCGGIIYQGKKHICRPAGPGAATATPAPRPAGTHYYTPSPKFDQMNAEQLSAFIENKIQWLTDKQRREAEYLEKRARRGSNTRTDDNYNADQPQESELLAFLVHFKKVVEGEK